MTKLAANLSMLFTEYDFPDRFEAAALAGFNGVEFLFPYAYEVHQIADWLKKYQLELVLHNLPAGNWEAGERGIACDPKRVREFMEGVDQAIHYATALNVRQVNCLAGILPANTSVEQAQQTLISNLRYAAEKLAAVGIHLLIEPINSIDIPGFFLTTSKQAVALIRQVGSDNLFLQYDIYHMQRMEGELLNTIKANFTLIKHIQVADNPGRGEPGTGEINYRFLFEQLTQLHYAGSIGCEYKPKAGTAAGLDWRVAHGV